MADAADLKSAGVLNPVWVRVPPAVFVLPVDPSNGFSGFFYWQTSDFSVLH